VRWLPLLFIAFPAHAEAPSHWERPFLWRIEGKHPSYLLGTMHLPDRRSGEWPPSLTKVVEQSEGVFVEVEMGFGNMMKAQVSMRLPMDQTLEQLLPPPLLQRVEKRVRATPGLFWFAEHVQQVWAVAMAIEMANQPVTGPILDMSLTTWAEAHQRQVGSLETLEEQLAVFDSMSLEDQIAELKAALDRLDSGSKGMEQLADAFYSGNEAECLRLVSEKGDPAAQRLNRRLLHDRNVRLTLRILSHLTRDHTQLFAVGVAHLVGKDGIVARLRKAGLHVERMP
jgi:uncharacterized protein YbaP (TraB family)